MTNTTIQIDGMNCGHCVMRVKKALGALPGVDVKDVKIGSAELGFDPTVITPEAIRNAVAKAGYEPRAD